MIQTDIVIAGGGLAGLSAAARLAMDGRRITLVDPAPAETGAGHDLRTTAFLEPAIATLTHAGIWDSVRPLGAELRVMRLVDAGGVERTPRETADFDGGTTEAGRFGWNLPNRAVSAALLDRLAALPTVTLRRGVSVTGFVGRDDAALVRLSDGTCLRCALVLAADGRKSTLRRLANIPHKTWSYGQKALVFPVTHEAPHDGISTEIHRTGGPLTLVPMPDHQGQPCSSVVWMSPGSRATALHALDDSALGQTLTAETMDLFGPLTIAGPRALWPIIGQAALRLTGQRLALIAEAAHVIPPIGAQGLNMSLSDIETLAGLIATADDPGDAALLARYERKHLPGTLARIAGIDLLNRAAMAESQPLRDLRRVGLSAIHRIAPLRRFAMRTGLGG